MEGSAYPRVFAGRYRVIGPIGRGAIAEVLRARDDQSDRHVALKIIYPHLRESAAVVERFRREVEVVRRIAHPHVLEILDLVESDGHLFLVMPFHGGGDLADRLALSKRLGVAELRLLAAQLCGALGAAHRAGVVHRDVKPSNVLVGPSPGLDVRLCDFGLARTADLSGLTTANAVLGTPEYMAPEVVSEGHADPRSDIYSLGVVLFEAATGRLPFSGDSPYQLMRQHVDVEAPRAGTLAPNLPPAIDDAIARALAKDPLDRFATAEDLARAFENRPPPELAAAPGALASAGDVAPAGRRTCRACGGWLVEAAGCCADCGATALRLVWERGGVSVLVAGPGAPADKIDARKHAALYRLLDELPAGTERKRSKRQRAPRLPFYVARGITTASARDLARRLQAIGFEALVEKGRALAPKKVRQRCTTMMVRYLAGGGVLIQCLPKPFAWMGHWARLIPIYTIVAVMVSSFLLSAWRSTRALVGPPAGSKEPGETLAALAATMSRLRSRHDRRLIGRILERLISVGAATGTTASAALGERAARAAQGLAALETHRALTVVSDGSEALEAVRREEVTRVILRADLLRAASRLDGVHLALSRAGASLADRAAEVDREIHELSLALESEQEVGALLEGTR